MSTPLVFLTALVLLLLAGVAANRAAIYGKLIESRYAMLDHERIKIRLRENTWQSISGLLLLSSMGTWVAAITLWIVR